MATLISPRLGIIGYPNVAPLTPPDTGNLVRRFAADAGVTKDGSNRVSLWVDQQASGNDLAQAIDGNKPIWAANQFGSLAGITCDKSAAQILTVATGAITKPTSIYMLVNQLAWASGESLMNDGIGAYTMQLFKSVGTPTLRMYADGYTPNLDTLPESTNGIITFVANGVSSASRYNLDAATVGGGAGTTSMTGIILGGETGATGYSNVRFGEILIYQGAHNTTQQDAAIRYLAQRGGVTV